MPGARDGVKDVYPDGMDPMVAFREGGSSCHGTSPLVTIPTPEARELPELCVSQQGAYPQCFSSTAAPYRKPDTDVQQPHVGPNQDHEQQLWPK